jgi:hypothetical protein
LLILLLLLLLRHLLSLLYCRIGKTKQAAAAGAAVAKGVATGMQAATVEIGSTLVQTVSTAAGKKDGDGSSSSGGGSKVPQPLAAVGGIGMELLRVSDPQSL